MILRSNAVKFTHAGKVGIKLYTIPRPSWGKEENHDSVQSTATDTGQNETSQTNCDRTAYHGHSNGSCPDQSLDDEPRTPNKIEASRTEDMEDQSHEATVWIRCDVYDTGIGIPGLLSFIFLSFPICYYFSCFTCSYLLMI